MYYYKLEWHTTKCLQYIISKHNLTYMLNCDISCTNIFKYKNNHIITQSYVNQFSKLGNVFDLQKEHNSSSTCPSNLENKCSISSLKLHETYICEFISESDIIMQCHSNVIHFIEILNNLWWALFIVNVIWYSIIINVNGRFLSYNSISDFLLSHALKNTRNFSYFLLIGKHAS